MKVRVSFVSRVVVVPLLRNNLRRGRQGSTSFGTRWNLVVVPHRGALFNVPFLNSSDALVQRCQVVGDPAESVNLDIGYQQNHIDGNVTLISVQAFTPILGTLLLSPNGMVNGPARCAVVDLLGRIRKADTAGEESIESADESYGLFGRSQRKMFEEEVLHQLVIGIGRLDAPVEEEITEVWYDASARTPATEIPGQTTRPCVEDTYDPNVNPYFPTPLSPPTTPISPPSPILATASFSAQIPQLSVVPPSPPPGATSLPPEFPIAELPSPIASISYHYEGGGSSPTRISGSQTSVPAAVSQPQASGEHHNGDDEVDPGEQAAVGRLSSMSLIAAVTASSTLTGFFHIVNSSLIADILGQVHYGQIRNVPLLEKWSARGRTQSIGSDEKHHLRWVLLPKSCQNNSSFHHW